jgi:excisionase family DNA binding protein
MAKAASNVQGGPQPRFEDLPDLVTVEAASAWLGCSVVTVRRMIAAGSLRRIKVGRLDRISRVSLARFVDGQEN